MPIVSHGTVIWFLTYLGWPIVQHALCTTYSTGSTQAKTECVNDMAHAQTNQATALKL